MDHLELQFIGIAQLVKFGLARQQGFGIEIQLVVQGSFATHHGIKVLAIHEAPWCATFEHIVERMLSAVLCGLVDGLRKFREIYRSELPDGRAGSAGSLISLRWLFTSRKE